MELNYNFSYNDCCRRLEDLCLYVCLCVCVIGCYICIEGCRGYKWVVDFLEKDLKDVWVFYRFGKVCYLLVNEKYF